MLVLWFGINGAGTFSCWAGANPKLNIFQYNHVTNYVYVKPLSKHDKASDSVVIGDTVCLTDICIISNY